MQREKASSWEAADPPAVVAPPGLLDGGLAPNAAAGRTRLAAAMTPAAVRIVGGHARRGGRMARVRSFIMRSSGSDDRGGRRRVGFGLDDAVRVGGVRRRGGGTVEGTRPRRAFAAS